jgi:hypothetical protein
LPSSLDELFVQLRSGAANVAGVTFQVSLSAMLLSAGRAGSLAGLPVVAVTPEGLEDVDCLLADGSRLLVQSKERGPGSQSIGAAELAGILAHAAPAIRLEAQASAASQAGSAPDAAFRRDGDAPAGMRLAVVTNGQFGSSLPHTGWTTTLDVALAGQPSGITVRKALLAALRKDLAEGGLDPELATVMLARTHLVRVTEDLGQVTVSLLQAGLGLHPALASLLRARLQCDLAEVAATQRQATFTGAVMRSLADLDAMAARLAGEVDVGSLDEAVAAGVCEPLDFMAASPQDARGFYGGVSVLPSHIAAGLDVLRPQESSQVLEGLADRGHVVIAGPSGSGKSALLWRCARLVEAGPRLLRVLRVATSADAQLLVRHVARALPSVESKVVVCIDDLGRARTAAWVEARERLVELPGVQVMGAGRREDLTPALSRGAVLVDAVLTQSAAHQIYQAVQAAGVSLVMAREEAVERADGLLMEFLALVTTGRRLRDVLAEQVAELGGTHRRLDRQVLRLVCAAHVLGFEVPADTLPAAMGQDPVALEEALCRLVGEHLVTGTGASGWKGLHDLRAEVLLDLLHSTGQPTIASTFAAAIMTLAAAARAQALRRAAVRIAKASAPALAELEAQDRLAGIHYALRPLAQCIATQLGDCTRGAQHQDATGIPAVRAAALLEAADRIDSVAHVYAALPVVEEFRRPEVEAATLLWLAWMPTDGVDFSGIPELALVETLGRALPQRTEETARAAGAALSPDDLVSLLCGTRLDIAVRLCEAAEGLITVSPEQAAATYRHYIPALPDPPGGSPGLDADLRAQLTGSLAVLANLRGEAVAAAFGNVEQRASDAVASDPFGCRVEVSFPPVDALDQQTSNLARAWAYSADRACAVHAISYARLDGAPVPLSAYLPDPGQSPESEHSQVIVLMRRLFDACPEADLVHAELWQANGMPRKILGAVDGHKTLRAGVLRRAQATSRNIAPRAAAAEAAGNESWTIRCRAQAVLVRDLMELLGKLPARLRSRDSAPARQEWTTKVRRAHEQASALPARPADHAVPLPAAQAAAMTHTAAGEDATLIDAMQQDAAKKALTTIASCLSQVAHAQGDARQLRGAGARLIETVPDLGKAIAQGAPSFSGIGETLPAALIARVTDTAQLLSAVEEPPVAVALRGGSKDLSLLGEAVHQAMQAVLDTAELATMAALAQAGITAVNSAALADPLPGAPWRDQELAFTVPLEQWPHAQETIRAWTVQQRETAGVRCRIVLIPIEDGEVLPMGIHLDSPLGQVLPLPEDRLEPLASAFGMPLRGNTTQAALQQPVEQLRAYSYDLVRRAHRTAGWTTDPDRPETPRDIADTFARQHADILAYQDSPESLPIFKQYQLIAVLALLELCDMVGAEDDQSSGLAAGLASVDITNPVVPDGYEAVARLNFALVAAIEADRKQPSTDIHTSV